ncbi:MAG: PBP1A family penicillin-binding protein [candidate division WOR-3 bacterium]|nr:PBP1A family penicillin-binding protein [candidate division WOR-3 bacterium]MCX7837088.1 PBP1A family penicillin-binding protein [candidate division WOR-3 bacterium]MDW8114253.1 PBP1A family penicillin-binding protein [candidate division WOR-3 bacterium]
MKRKTYKLFLICFFLSLIFFFLIIPIIYYLLSSDLPSLEEIQTYLPPVSSRVLDCKGRLIGEFFEQKRKIVSLREIPKYLIDALITVEDKRFYSHCGIDVIRIIGALFYNLKSLSIKQGASTITQQLARNMFLTYKKDIIRKLKELILAIKLERSYTKEEILERYLNQVYFGYGLYGIEAASQGFLGKSASDLTLSEAAFLVSIVKSPNYYSPYKNFDLVLKRRNFFLKMLYKNKKISKEEYEKALEEKINLLPLQRNRQEVGYIMEMVRQYVEDFFGTDYLYKRGLTIYTTIDLDIQREANIALEKRLREIEENYGFKEKKRDYDKLYKEKKGELPPPDYLQGALVCIENKTGFIKALIGGRDFFHSQLNRVVQTKRQPGSAFKVFVYTAAIDQGFKPSDIIEDSPISLEITGVQEPYEPKNYDHRYIGPITLRKALALSRNVCAVRLIEKLTPEKVSEYAYLMGINSKLRPYYSLALGSSEVSLLEMARSFATLANLGKKIVPILITKIVDSDGIVLKENYPSSESVLSPQTAFLVTTMLKSVLDEGTGYLIRKYGYYGIGAGKTGTTDNFTDAWFIGYTPYLTCGIWVGFDKKKKIFEGATGGVVCAPVWGEFMKNVSSFYPQNDFFIPDSIVRLMICEETGDLATSNCLEIREEYFLKGNEPTKYCSKHRF